jgi:hypothetical protein
LGQANWRLARIEHAWQLGDQESDHEVKDETAVSCKNGKASGDQKYFWTSVYILEYAYFNMIRFLALPNARRARGGLQHAVEPKVSRSDGAHRPRLTDSVSQLFSTE